MHESKDLYKASTVSKTESPRLNKVKMKLLSRVRLFVTPWTVAYQASPSMEFSRQEDWSGLPFPSPADLPDPKIYQLSHQGNPYKYESYFGELPWWSSD